MPKNSGKSAGFLLSAKKKKNSEMRKQWTTNPAL